MPLPDSFMDELKLRSDIVDVVSSYVSLKRHGRNMVGLCPFHGEKTPSFNLYPQSGSFYCFGCGVGGDVITFIRMIENLDYIDAVKFLAQRAGLEVPIDNREDGLSKLKKRIYEANREAARYYHYNLYDAKSKEGYNYFKSRGLSDRTIKHFGLGYAADSRFNLVNYLTSKGFTNEELLEANLAIKSRNGVVIDRFFGRVMFPIIDLRGNVVAFGGRVLSDIKPKYLNTADTLVFKKHYNLFALNFAKSFCKDKIILAEGYMDVIALHQAGFENTVATLGTSLTREQVNIISRYTKEVIIAYDADQAGQKATARAISMFRDTELLVKVLTIPSGKDPDEYIKSYGENGAVRFKQLLEKSSNDIEYSLKKIRLDCDLQSPEGKVRYVNEAVKMLANINNRLEREVYAGKISEELDIEKSAITFQIEKLVRNNRKKDVKKEFKYIQTELSSLKDDINPQKRDNLRAAHAEEAIISYLINNPQKVNNISSKLKPDDFLTDFNRRVYNIIIDKVKNNMNLNLTSLSSDFSIKEMGRIAKMLSSYIECENDDIVVDEYIKVILDEKERISLSDAANSDIKDIKEYFDKLKELKQ